MAITIYIPLIHFYLNTSHSKVERCEHLTESLAKTLTHLYPLAGRIKGNAAVECNDDGTEFVKARVNCSLSEILENPDANMLELFLPAEILSTEAGTGPLLLVQVNMFECGGIAIGFSISHKIADPSTLCSFINCWAKLINTTSSTSGSEVSINFSCFSYVKILYLLLKFLLLTGNASKIWGCISFSTTRFL